MGEALALAALALFSSNVLLIKVAALRLGQQLGFLVALIGNVAFAAVLFVGMQVVRDGPLRMDWQAVVLFAAAGIFSSYLGRRWFFRSIETIGPSRASALQITNPAFAAVLAFLILGDRLTPIDAIALTAVLLGLLLTSRVAEKEQVDVGAAEGVAIIPLGVRSRVASVLRPSGNGLPRREIALALFSALAYAFGNVVRSDAVRRWDEPVLGGLLGAGTATLVYLTFHTRPSQLWRQVSVANRSGLLLWGFSGVITVTAQICVIASTRHIEVAVALAIASPLPLLVVPFSLIIFGNQEQLTRHTAAGIGLIMAGVGMLMIA